MKNKNICLFITKSEENILNPETFVLESNLNAIKKASVLKYNTVYLVASGSADFVFDGKSTQAKRGSLVFGFGNEKFHAENASNDFECMYVSFSGGRADELFRRFNISEGRRKFDGLEGLIPFWHDSITRANEENTDLISESVLLYSFSRLTKTQAKSENIANMVLDIIEEEFNDSSLSLSSVADRLGYNAKYLSHSFKEKTGAGFSQYLKNVRIKHAVFLMEHGVDSVKNIAFLCGFTDPLYFSTVFKEALGIPPREYIKQKN